MTNNIKTTFSLIIFIFTLNSIAAQTKSVRKAQKAYLEKNWEKFNDYLIKEKKSDSTSLGSYYLNYLNNSNDGPKPEPKNQLLYCQLFFNKFQSQELEVIKEYCDNLKICVDNKNNLIDSSITNYSNWIIQRKDTGEAMVFLENYSSHRQQLRVRNVLYTEFYNDLLAKPNIIKAKYYLEKFPESQFYSVVFSMYDSLVFQSAISIYTNIAFKEYLNRIPDGKYKDSAQSIIDRLDWELIDSSNNIADFVKYRSEHMKSRFLSNATIRETELSWNQVKNQNSIEKIQEFLLRYPNSKYQIDASKIEAQLAFNLVKNSNSIENLQEFRIKYNDIRYNDSSLRIEEELSYLNAKELNTIDLFESHIISYPNSRFNKSVDSMIFSYYTALIQGNYNSADLTEINRKINHTKTSKYIGRLIRKLKITDSLILLNNKIVNGSNFITPKNVTITPNSITIKSSKPILFKDKPGDDRYSGTHYEYLTYIPILESHEILKSEFDAPNPFLINEKTFKITELKGRIHEFFRIDTSFYFMDKNECYMGNCEGFQIYKKNRNDIKRVFSFIPDSLDPEVFIDSLYYNNSKIYCSISKNEYQFNIKINIGTAEFSIIDGKWEKTNFIIPTVETNNQIDKSVISKLIETRQPFFTSGLSNYKKESNSNSLNSNLDQSEDEEKTGSSQYYFMYSFDSYGELKPLETSKKLALYPILFVNDTTIDKKRRFDLICTSSPMAGTDYANFDAYKRSYNRQNSLIFIKFDDAVRFNEIQNLPIELNDDALELQTLFYSLYNKQHPSSLSPFQFCSFMAKEYTFIDEFKKKKIIESWSKIFLQELIKRQNSINKKLDGTLNLSLYVHVNEYNMNTKSFTIETVNEHWNDYDHKSAAPDLKLLNTPNFSSQHNNYLNQIDFFSISINNNTQPNNKISNSSYRETLIIGIDEEKAADISNILNGDRNIYLSIKTKLRERDYSINCNPCPNANCELYQLQNCKIQFDAIEFEFAANPNFKNSINVKSQ
ncbi:MAG: hypothetical protein O2814_07055 [Bacteroidetes bacterium]|nr:hypothetical protein [Bacteroidota bacterium]